ncbi:polymer-forming cytoskeletal protein, partial [Candidatus Saccharibacteria bacterium]|nr:polymer-forming cytoskeletal protein [Candidatus Saccharibacteria bacterium]
LFTGGSTVNIAGTVNGDLYCAGQDITISGLVKGDVICAGQNVSVSGKIEGSVRIAGQTVNISGSITGSATIATQSLTVDKSGSIERDLLGGSQNVTINGAVKRDVVSGATNLTVNGLVGRNIKAGLKSLSVGPNGQITGNVEYTGPTDPVISAGGSIKGAVKRTQPTAREQWASTNMVVLAIGFFVYTLLSVLVLSIAVVLLIPRTLNEASALAIKSPGHTVLVGAAVTFLAPIAVICLMMTVIGIPLGMLAIISSMIIIALITPFAGYLTGRVLFKSVKKPIWTMLSGTLVLFVAGLIPVVGFIVGIIAYLFGSGMILIQVRRTLSRNRLKTTHV